MAIRLTDQVKKLLQKKYKRKQGTRVGSPKKIMQQLSKGTTIPGYMAKDGGYIVKKRKKVVKKRKK
tara:strand:+ start:498 stop:695 length:198 start_codon:yes stop_codon:yes gene_type:complete